MGHTIRPRSPAARAFRISGRPGKMWHRWCAQCAGYSRGSTSVECRVWEMGLMGVKELGAIEEFFGRVWPGWSRRHYILSESRARNARQTVTLTREVSTELELFRESALSGHR